MMVLLYNWLSLQETFRTLALALESFRSYFHFPDALNLNTLKYAVGVISVCAIELGTAATV